MNQQIKFKDHLAAVIHELGVALPLGRGLRRLYSDKHWAFRNVTFNIRDGETIALLGRNGSGKTTFLRALAGIIAPDEGSLNLRPGLNAQILSPGAGFVGQLTGRENLVSSAILQGFTLEELKNVEERILEIAEIGHWIDQPVSTYSAGMRARLGFSLSVCLPSDLLLIDESLSAGDPPFREKARNLINELVESRRTVILVSHGLRYLSQVCDRGVILDGGKLREVGKIDTVLDSYRSLVDQTRHKI